MCIRDRHCAVRKMMKIRGQAETAECPRCREEEVEEDVEHLLRCPHEEAQQIWEDSLKELREELDSRHTMPAIKEAICTGLDQWRRSELADFSMPEAPEVVAAFELQCEVGWQSLVEGRPITAWRNLQELHYRTLNKNKSIRRWTTALAEKMLKVANDLWRNRNRILHDKEDSVLLDEITRNIFTEFEHGFVGLDLDPRIYSPGRETIALRTRFQQERWLRRVRAARHAAQFGQHESEREPREYAQEARSMAEWLGRYSAAL